MLNTVLRLPYLCLLVLGAFFASGTSVADAKGKPLRIYLLAGQSNMVGTGAVSTIEYLGDDPATAPLLKRILNDDGKPGTCDRVWISSLNGKSRQPGGVGQGKLSAGYGVRREDPTKPGDCIGPEYGFGITMEDNYDGPILIIKTAWGGHSLHVEFRPPSAGELVLPDEMVRKLEAKSNEALADKQSELKEFTGKYYRRTIDHVKTVLGDIEQVVPGYDRSSGYELAGVVWFHGWNDYAATGVYPTANGESQYSPYSDLLCHFIRDVRKDLKTPRLPFVIGVMGVNGNYTPGTFSGPRDGQLRMKRFRNAMAFPALLPEFRENVVAVPTAPFWDDDVAALGMKQLKIQRMRRLIFKKSPDGPNVDGKMTQAEVKTYMDDYNRKIFGSDELELKKRTTGTGGFVHSYGSAKFHIQAGDAFAKALLRLVSTGPSPVDRRRIPNGK